MGVSNNAVHTALDQQDVELIETRAGRLHARQRLGIEADSEARVFGQGLNFFHPENWYAAHRLIRALLRAGGLYGRGQRNAAALRLLRNEVAIRNLPSAFDGYTLLHISDPHLDMSLALLHVLIEQVRRVEYDLCVITGDLRAETHGSIEPALDALRQLRAHLTGDVYAVLGNHDSLRMVPAMETMGIRVLLNESAPIERHDARIHLAGVDDPHYFRADNLEKAMLNVADDAVCILLCHTPELYRNAAHAGVSLLLCGHTHGGQICLPGGVPLFYNARCPRRFCKGAWSYAGMRGYTSSGSGACIVNARFNCPPEITLHVMRRL
jgi:hypothetical protein